MFHDVGHVKVKHEPVVQRVDACLHKAALRLGRVNGPEAELDGQIRRPKAFLQLPQYRGLPRSFLAVEHETLAERPAGDLAVNTLKEFSPAEEHLLLLDRGTAGIPAIWVGDAYEFAGLLEHERYGPGGTLGDLAGGATEPETQGYPDLTHAQRQVGDLQPLDKLPRLTRPQRLQEPGRPERAQVGVVLEQELNALNRGTSGREANRHSQKKRLIVLDVEVLSGDQADKVRRRYGGAKVKGVLGVHHVRQLPQQRAEVRGRLLPFADRGIQRRVCCGDILAGLRVRGLVAFIV